MKRVYVVYRCLYGEDFAQESIRSIEPYADRIFVFWDDTPWGDVRECTYKGEKVRFPERFDDVVGRIEALNNPKIHMERDHQYNNIGQFTHLVNDLVLDRHLRPDLVLVMEIDHVFREDQIRQALDEVDTCGHINASSRQVEVWKGLHHRVPERPYRTGAVFWDMRKVARLPQTGRQAEGQGMGRLGAYVHNFGFAFSDKVMYWKHMLALGFSEKIGDGRPNEGWLDRWRNWKPDDRNLEISEGYEHLIPEVVPYPVTELPEEIRRTVISG